MCDIKDLTGLNCPSKTPGTKTTIYYSPVGEHTAYPRTEAVIKTAAAETVLQGDTQRLGEPFDFSGAATGKGYWRRLPAVLDTGKLEAIMQGEIASQSFDNMIDFEVSGTSPEHTEFAADLTRCCEGFVFMIPTKDEEHLVIGEPGLGVQPVAITIGTGQGSGDKKGGVYQLKVNTATPFKHYDAATHGIDITANP